jgi:opacity protein-like surface antigen
MMKKMTKITFLIFGLFISTAQAQQSVNAAGGNATGSGGTVSFSIGQIDYTCNEGVGGTVSLGVQQLDELSKFLHVNIPKPNLEIIVYPNPATEFVNLKIENYDSNSLSYALFDIQGRQLDSKKIIQDDTQIQLNNLASAIYLLSVSDGDQLLKTFKIIKRTN